MNDGFVKLYGGKLLDSTLWLEGPNVRLVFLGMLAIADADGVVDLPGTRVLARRLNLPLDYVEDALDVLMAPDKDSRSKELDGRRVVELEVGWRCVNYEKYREYRGKRQEQARVRQARFREKSRAKPVVASGIRDSARDSVTDNARDAPEAEDRIQKTEAAADDPATAADACREFGDASGHTYPLLSSRDDFGSIAAQANDYPNPAATLREATRHFWREDGWAQTDGAGRARPIHLAKGFHREVAEMRGEVATPEAEKTFAQRMAEEKPCEY